MVLYRIGGEICRHQYRCLWVPLMWSHIRGTEGRLDIPCGCRNSVPRPSGRLAMSDMRCCQDLLPNQECGGGRICPKPTIWTGWEHIDGGTEESCDLWFPLGILCSFPFWLLLTVTVACILPLQRWCSDQWASSWIVDWPLYDAVF